MTGSPFSSPQMEKQYTHTHVRTRRQEDVQKRRTIVLLLLLLFSFLPSFLPPFGSRYLFFNRNKIHRCNGWKTHRHSPSVVLWVHHTWYFPQPSLWLNESYLLALFFVSRLSITHLWIFALCLPLCFFCVASGSVYYVYMCFFCVSVPVHPSYLQLNRHRIATP